MDLASFRASRGLTQLECARELGLAAKSYISAVESGAIRAPLRMALQIEAWSEGQVPADQLVDDDDRQLLARHRQIASRRQPAEARA